MDLQGLLMPSGAAARCSFRAGVHDVLGAALGHELEILDEARGQSLVLAVVLVLAGPGVGRIEDLRRNAFAFGGHIESEDRVRAKFDRVELPREGRVQKRAGVPDADPLADAERPAGPSGVDQPTGGAVLQQPRFQHFGVGIGAMYHEGAAETGAERDFRLRAQADLGAGDLAGVDRKSTRLNSSHANISYAVFCLT